VRVARDHFYPSDDVTLGELLYLQRRYGNDDAEARRQRIAANIRRLVRRGKDRERIHRDLMTGIRLWTEHRQTRPSRQAQQEVARVAKQLTRALAALRRLLPPIPVDEHTPRFLAAPIDDDELFAMRDILLAGASTSSSTPQPRGRPKKTWVHETDAALREDGVPAFDRRELLSAIGFLEDA
jgi:hypothetical protein